MGKRGGGAFFVLFLLISVILADWQESDYPYPIPQGLQAPSIPADNKITDAKVELGKMLYFDKRLSLDNTVSCATCHNPQKGWTDQEAVSTGIKGQKGTMNSPTVLNSAYNDFQFWDGRASSLEEQAKGPMENPVEMGFSHEGVVQRLRGIKGYVKLFKKAFGKETEITIDQAAQAIASFERTVLTGSSAFDKFQAGEKTALSDSAQRGMTLFFDKAKCSECHSGFNFSDSDFHNLGVGANKNPPDKGRAAVTGQTQDQGAFKTPTLRNLSSTFPYMHDGSQKTLEEVIDFYDKGGEPNKHLDPKMKPLGLTPAEKADLLAFLKALNGNPVLVDEPELPK